MSPWISDTPPQPAQAQITPRITAKSSPGLPGFPSPSQTEMNKSQVSRLYLDFINKRDWALLPQLLAPDFTNHTTGEKGVQGFEKGINEVLSAVPDIQFTVNDILGEGDKVAVRWTWKGTHMGPFKGKQPTNKPISNSANVILKLRDGLITDLWFALAPQQPGQ